MCTIDGLRRPLEIDNPPRGAELPSALHDTLESRRVVEILRVDTRGISLQNVFQGMQRRLRHLSIIGQCDQGLHRLHVTDLSQNLGGFRASLGIPVLEDCQERFDGSAA